MSRPTYRLENQYHRQGYKVLAGLDEAGKGAWAGPVVCAAVILPEKIDLPKLNDSKLLSASLREKLFDSIQEQALSFGIGVRTAGDVDELGLAEAHRQALNEAVEKLEIKPDLLLVDGKGIKGLMNKYVCIVKGDQRSVSIAAASVLAKVTRDQLMAEYHDKHPHYGFRDHKGYGTQAHQQALVQHGPSFLHRFSYAPIARLSQTSLFEML